MKKTSPRHPATLGLLFVAFATSAFGADITIDKTNTQQNLWGIGGFFGDKVATTLLKYSLTKQTEICDLLFKNSGSNAGFTAGRMIINADVRPSSTQWDWSQDADQRWFVKEAFKRDFDPRGLLAVPWTPPTYMKSPQTPNGQDSTGHTAVLNSQYFDAFAQYLWDWKNTMATTYGITVAGVSVQNEPDMSPPYAGCFYSKADFNTVAGKVCDKFASHAGDTTMIGAPECCTVNNSLDYCAAMSAANKGKLGYFPTHDYGGVGDLHSVGTPTLCTEDCDQSDTPHDSIDDAITWAGNIHDNLKNSSGGGSVGFLFWRMINTGSANQGLINLTDPANNVYDVTKRFYVFAQFSRAIRYGDKRIATTNSLPLLQVIASKNPNTGKAKLVLVNTASGWSGDIVIAGFGNTSYLKVWRTGTQNNMAPITPDIHCSGGSFHYNAPDKSITTFIEQ